MKALGPQPENRMPDRLALLHDSGGVAVRCAVHDHAHEWMNTCNGGTFCWNVLGSEEYAERVPWRCTPAWHNGTHLSLSTQRWAHGRAARCLGSIVRSSPAESIYRSSAGVQLVLDHAESSTIITTGNDQPVCGTAVLELEQRNGCGLELEGLSVQKPLHAPTRTTRRRPYVRPNTTHPRTH